MPMSGSPEEDIVEAIYRGTCDTDGLIQAVQLIGQYFNSAGVVLSELDMAVPDSPLLLGTKTFDESYFTRYGAYAQFDPAPAAFAALPVGKVSTVESLVPIEFLRRNPFLNEFLKPLDIDTALGGTLFADKGRLAMVSVLGATNRERFGQEDIARLERLTPHLRRALQIRRQFLRSRLRSQTLESVVERNPAGIIALDSGEAPLFVNAAARTMAGARDGLALDREGRPVLADHAAGKRLTAVQAEVLKGGAGGIVHVQRPSGRSPYLILVSPLPKMEDVLPRTRRGVLFIIHDPGRRLLSAVERIAQVLQVPLGAARVVEALISGVELKDHAEREGISVNTVKFHLKTAFERTGTRSQLELLRRAILALDDLGRFLEDGAK
jgi:PAS domain-containing protein